MRWMMAAGAVLGAALAACTARKHGSPAISRERFVLANADLRSVPDTVPNGDSLRTAALRKHRVTEVELRRFVNVHGRNAEYMASVWREIADSVQKRYDRTFPLVHPTHEAPNVPPNQPPNLVPAAGQPIGQQPPPAGVQPRSPRRPRPPKLPANGPRMVPQGNRPPPAPPPPPSPTDTLREER